MECARDCGEWRGGEGLTLAVCEGSGHSSSVCVQTWPKMVSQSFRGLTSRVTHCPGLRPASMAPEGQRARHRLKAKLTQDSVCSQEGLRPAAQVCFLLEQNAPFSTGSHNTQRIRRRSRIIYHTKKQESLTKIRVKIIQRRPV